MSTPYEINQHAIGRNQRIKNEIQTSKALVWSLATLSRTSKFPSYDSWMGNGRENNSLSELESKRADHLMMIDSLNAQIGNPSHGN